MKYIKWIKISGVILSLIALFGLAYNSKYLFAYIYIKKSKKLFKEGKIEEAYKNMNSASEKSPHNEHLKRLTDLYEGIYLLYNDESVKALALFNSYKEYYPKDPDIKMWILKAEAGAAYDLKDHKTFYLKQKELYNLTPDNVASIIGAASGASCLFVETSNDKYKEEMYQYFKLAYEKMQPEEEEFVKEYVQQIKYRIYSGQIISSDEYYEIFPEGWKLDY